jgi:hypothetical protein
MGNPNAMLSPTGSSISWGLRFMKRRSLVRILPLPLVWTCQKKNKSKCNVIGFLYIRQAHQNLEAAKRKNKINKEQAFNFLNPVNILEHLLQNKQKVYNSQI